MTSGANEEAADVLLSEQRLRVGTEWVPRERLSVRRRVVTETRQVTVAVRREELLIDRVPVEHEYPVADPGARAPLVVVLHEEVPVVDLQVRPYEQVTIRVERVDGQEVVDDVVARETAEVVVDADAPPG